MTNQSPTTTANFSPFHPGERNVQLAAGVREEAERRGLAMIKPELSEQHREFFQHLPFVVTGYSDSTGQPWAGLIVGRPGFLSAKGSNEVQVDWQQAHNPLQIALAVGSEVALLGIDFANRRRNRINTTVETNDLNQLRLTVQQAYGNCPKYIVERNWQSHWFKGNYEQVESGQLTACDKVLIENAQTFFIATSSGPKLDDSSTSPDAWGADISHRGGDKGFVQVRGHQLSFSDFPGNNLFNTLGNLQQYPFCGLLFLNFDNGALLQLAGKAELDQQRQKVHIDIINKRLWRKQH